MLYVHTGRPVGHIPPCLPSRADRPPAGPEWLHEIKHDGFRIMALRDDNGVRLYTRNGYDFAGRFPQIVDAVSKLKVRSCFIDGEAIVVNERGLSAFDLLRSWRHDHAAVLCAFDLIELDGKDLRRVPIEQRKQALARSSGRARNKDCSAKMKREGSRRTRQAAGTTEKALNSLKGPAGAKRGGSDSEESAMPTRRFKRIALAQLLFGACIFIEHAQAQPGCASSYAATAARFQSVQSLHCASTALHAHHAYNTKHRSRKCGYLAGE
jgi:hypothetical protein